MGIKARFQNRKHGYALIISLVLLLTSVLSSSIVFAEVQTNKALKQYISTSMNQLVVKLKENQDEYKNDKELFYRDLNIELSKVIDFKRIALKVMGKHGRTASKAQRAQFIQIFKQSLYKTYAQVLLENNEVEISVVNATLNPRNTQKAKVNIAIKSAGGSNYDVSYSLHKGKDQTYRVENIVVMGINLGLAYKDRFQQQVKANKGNIKSVIENWSFDDAV
jgi:phospholipid transport system substrate-binding protein